MFSLLITLIAIALVAALALATLYYGGPVFNEGSERALAAKLDAQGQQIMGALELYNAEVGHYPATLNDLVSTNYLKAIPTAAAEQAVMAAAYAATGTWSLSSPGKPVIVMKPVSLATCQAFNKSNLGVSGVLQQAHSTVLKQCIGTDVNNLMIVQPKSASDLTFVSTDPNAVVQIGAVLGTPVPTIADTSTNGWLSLTSTPPAIASIEYTDTDTGQVITSLAFPTIEIDSMYDKYILVKNTGTQSITFTATDASFPFSIWASGNECAGATLAPGASCGMEIDFFPLSAMTYSGDSYSLKLFATGLSLPSLPLTGTATEPVPPPSLASCIVPFDNVIESQNGDGTVINGLRGFVNVCEGMQIEVTNPGALYSYPGAAPHPYVILNLRSYEGSMPTSGADNSWRRDMFYVPYQISFYNDCSESDPLCNTWQGGGTVTVYSGLTDEEIQVTYP